jgi:hypothetical protein
VKPLSGRGARWVAVTCTRCGGGRRRSNFIPVRAAINVQQAITFRFHSYSNEICSRVDEVRTARSVLPVEGTEIRSWKLGWDALFVPRIVQTRCEIIEAIRGKWGGQVERCLRFTEERNNCLFASRRLEKYV